MEGEAVAEFVEERADEEFWFGILRLDAGYVPTAAVWCEFVTAGRSGSDWL